MAYHAQETSEGAWHCSSPFLLSEHDQSHYFAAIPTYRAKKQLFTSYQMAKSPAHMLQVKKSQNTNLISGFYSQSVTSYNAQLELFAYT